MAKDRIPDDATVASVTPLLEDADHYVSQVYGKARKASNREGSSVDVRIGVTGVGAKPNYRLERRGSEGDKVIIASYRGDNHTPLFELNSDLEASNWSTKSMTTEEVAEILGTIRNYRQPEKRPGPS